MDAEHETGGPHVAFSYERADSSAEFSLRFRPCTRHPASWKEELASAARRIASIAHRDIWICSSGGFDSEIACRAFYDQGLHFTVLTLAYEGGSNRREVRRAAEWCDARHVQHVVVPFDIVGFLTQDIFRYAGEWPAIHPFRYQQLKLLELVEERNGYAVLCSNDLLVRAPSEGPISRDRMHVRFSNGTVLPLEWCRSRSLRHEPYFHMSTPELCLSYLRTPVMTWALERPEIIFTHPSNTHLLKRMLYLAEWPDVHVRTMSDGFEALRAPADAAQQSLRREYSARYAQRDMSVESIIRDLASGLPGGDTRTV